MSIIVALLAACAGPADLALLPPWQIVYSVAPVTPLASPALLVDGSQRLLAWPGDLRTPNIRLLELPDAGAPAPEPIPLPLGIRPGAVSIHPQAGGWRQLFWLDEREDGRAMLVGGTLDPIGEVQRGPTPISAGPVLEYVAVPAPAGEVRVFWVELEGERAVLKTALVDSIGRPRPVTRLADAARHPAAALDESGGLHLAWLEPTPGRLWNVQYAYFPGGQVPDSAIERLPVGVIRLNQTQALETLALAVDRSHVYAMWGLVTVTAGEDGGVRGAVGGLVFARESGQSARTLALDALTSVSGRWPVAARGHFAPEGAWFGLSVRDAGAPPLRPLIMRVTAEGIAALLPVVADTPAGPPIGPLALQADQEGGLHLAWAGVRPDGSGAIHYVTRSGGAEAH
jgi:hypothetical protein